MNKPYSPRKVFLGLTVVMLLTLGVMAVFYRIPVLYSIPWHRELLVWPVTGILLWSYWRGAQLVGANTPEGSKISIRWILFSGLALAMIATLIPAFHSTDMYGYVNRGWQQLHYHMNPYVHPIGDIPHWGSDPMLTNHWVNNPSPYGFLYLLIAKGLCWLGHGDRATTLVYFKVGNLCMHLLTAGLIGFAASRLRDGSLGQNGKLRPALSLYLYLWNPLILINTLSNGHNDIFMGFFVTLSAVFAVVGAWLWILPALMAATLIKYGAVVIVPWALLFLVKQKAWLALVGGILLSALIFGLTGIPYLPDWAHFNLAEINHNAFVSHGSLHSLIFSAYKTLAKEVFPALYTYKDTVRTGLKNMLLLIYAGYCGWTLWKRSRQTAYSSESFLRDALLAMALLVCFISLKFYPWYLMMFFPLGLLLPEGDALRRWLLILSGAQLLSITFVGQAHLLNFLLMTALPTVWVLKEFLKKGRRSMKS